MTSSAARLCRFNIVGRPRSNRARVCWSRQRHRDRFPGSNGLDDDVDPGQGAFDLSLHALNLALQECLQLLELGREPFESLYRISCSTGLLISTSPSEEGDLSAVAEDDSTTFMRYLRN